MRLDLMFSMSLCKEFQLLQILHDLSIKHLIKLILCENNVKLLQFIRSPLQVDFWYVVSVRLSILIPEMNALGKVMEWLICFSIINLMLGCLLFKNLKNLMNFVPCQKQQETVNFMTINFVIKLME